MKKVFGLFMFLGLLAVGSGFAETVEKCPYEFQEYKIVSGVLKESPASNVALIAIANKTKKQISKFTMVLSLCNEEGECVIRGGKQVRIDIFNPIQVKKSLPLYMLVDEYVENDFEGPYKFETLYLERVVFEDGTVWSDLYGRYGVEGASAE